jgi:predicted amidohydrolase
MDGGPHDTGRRARGVSRRALLAGAGAAVLAAAPAARALGRAAAAGGPGGLEVAALHATLEPYAARDPLRTPARLLPPFLARLEAVAAQRAAGGRTAALLLVGGLPLQGLPPPARAGLERLAIALPGPETEAVGALARRHRCTIAFACYAREPDWPGHVLDVVVVIGPDGRLLHRQWRARAAPGRPAHDGGRFVTTVADARGRPAPGPRTVLSAAGRLRLSVEGVPPSDASGEGADLLVLLTPNGANARDAVAGARTWRTYAVGLGGGLVAPGDAPARAASEGRDTAIVAPDGRVLARTGGAPGGVARATLPPPRTAAHQPMP